MNFIKRFVVWLFDIRPEDIASVNKTPQLSNEAKKILQDEVKKYLDQAILEYIIPEIHKSIQNSGFSENPLPAVEKSPKSGIEIHEEFPEIIEEVSLDFKSLPESEATTQEINTNANIQSSKEILPLELNDAEKGGIEILDEPSEDLEGVSAEFNLASETVVLSQEIITKDNEQSLEEILPLGEKEFSEPPPITK
jgi:hypothetical protein